MSNNSKIGDASEVQHVLVHPIGASRKPLKSSASRGITQLLENAFYWILQLVTLWLTISFNILRDPMVWLVLKIICNVVVEMFFYMVLGACSFLISIIIHMDDYFSKRRHQAKRFRHSDTKASGGQRDGLEVQNYINKKFVEIPKTYN